MRNRGRLLTVIVLFLGFASHLRSQAEPETSFPPFSTTMPTPTPPVPSVTPRVSPTPTPPVPSVTPRVSPSPTPPVPTKPPMSEHQKCVKEAVDESREGCLAGPTFPQIIDELDLRLFLDCQQDLADELRRCRCRHAPLDQRQGCIGWVCDRNKDECINQAVFGHGACMSLRGIRVKDEVTGRYIPITPQFCKNQHDQKIRQCDLAFTNCKILFQNRNRPLDYY